MVLVLCVVAFIVFSIVEADGADWVQGQKNADRRTRQIINAIHSSTDKINECSRLIWDEQKEYNKQFLESCSEDKHFQDSHGRWFRERLVYDSEGRIIAKEVVGIEQ